VKWVSKNQAPSQVRQMAQILLKCGVYFKRLEIRKAAKINRKIAVA
jgi:hypothetical protein